MSEISRELVIDATVENLSEVQAFLESNMEEAGCSPKVQMQVSLISEEIFVNIAHYAYKEGTGTATVHLEISDTPATVTVTFLDHGTPFDPLARPDPDVTLPVEERGIGGLGIFMTKKTMDEVTYEYKDGQNILKIRKNL